VPGEAVARKGTWVERSIPQRNEQLPRLLEENYVFSGVLLARAHYEMVGGYRDFRGTEDWDLWLRLVRSGVFVTAPSHPTVLYRLRGGSLTAGGAYLSGEIAVLEAFLSETEDEQMRGIARRRLAVCEANVFLHEAYLRASTGDVWQARRQALRAAWVVRGVSRLAAAGVAIAPRTAVQARDRLQGNASWQVNR
jgi:hypothetical protein